MSRVPVTDGDIDVDLRELFASLARNWIRILVVALVVAALALVVTFIATPKYRGETRILIETRESVFTRPEQERNSERPILDEEGVVSQVEVIGSTDLLKKVAVELDLAGLDEFDAAARVSMFESALIILGLMPDPIEIPPEERVLKSFRDKLNVYRVKDSRVIVIEFSSEDPKLAASVPNAIAEAYIALQRDAKLQSDADATDWLEPEIANLRQRVKQAEARVAEFRSQSDLLIGQNNSVLATQQLAELSSELSRVRASRASAEAKAASIKNAIESGVALDTVPDVLSSELIQRLRERQVQLNADIADLSTTLLEGHPRIKSLRSQLARLDRQIESEASKVLQAQETEARTARFREQELVARLNELKAESARAGDEQVELRDLERDAAAQRELLESYLTRYREASSRKDGKYLPVDARIFSRATVPAEPYFPKKVPIVGASFFAALLVMAVITLMRELFSGRAMRQTSGVAMEPVRDVEMAPVAPVAPAAAPVVQAAAVVTATPVAPPPEPAAEPVAEPAAAKPKPSVESLVDVASRWFAKAEGTAPKAAAEPEPAAQEARKDDVDAREPVVEPARASRRRVVELPEEPEYEPEYEAEPEYEPEPEAPAAAADMDDPGEHGIEEVAERLIASGVERAVVVSPEGDEAAAAAVLLAREIADCGLRVLLLDLTGSGAAGSPMLDGAVLPGITDLLASQAQFRDVIHPDRYSDCHVIPSGLANPARAMRAIERLPIILDSLATAYDLVLVECGPTNAAGISRIAGGAKVLMSVIEPADDVVLRAATELHAAGYDDLILVTPVGHTLPSSPIPGRSVA